MLGSPVPCSASAGEASADERSDRYALGAMLYEMLTGRCAHEGASIYAVIRTVGEGSFPPPMSFVDG